MGRKKRIASPPNPVARPLPPVKFTDEQVRVLAETAVDRALAVHHGNQFPSEFPMMGSPQLPAAITNPVVNPATGMAAIADQKLMVPPTNPGAFKWDHPIWWVVPHNPVRRPNSELSLDDLRLIADRYDVIRSCIEHLKADAVNVPLFWQVRDGRRETARLKKGIEELTDWFDTPGGLGGKGVSRTQFEYSIFDDLCVTGCVAAHLDLTNGGDVTEAVDIDSATIRPRVNAYGFAQEGDWKYEQWIYGTVQALFDDKDMIYSGIYRLTRTPFYASPLEWLLKQVEQAVAYDQWNLSWLRDGNTPDAWIESPESWTVENLQTYTAYLDALLSGDIPNRSKVKVLAPGAKPVKNQSSRKDMEFISGEQWLARRCAVAYGVHLSSMGFEGQDYAANVANSSRSTSTTGTGRILRWRKEFYDEIARRKGYGDLECVNEITDLAALQMMSQIDSTDVGAGVRTPNEARKARKMRPWTPASSSPADQLYMNGTMQTLHDAVNQQANSIALAKAKPAGAKPAGGGAGANNNAGASKVGNNSKANSARNKTTATTQ